MEEFKLANAVHALAVYLDETVEWDRAKIMGLVHDLNEAYVTWADLVDKTEISA